MRYVAVLFTLILNLTVPARSLAQTDTIIHRLSPDLQVRSLDDGVWLHTWWMELEPYGRFSSNGLIVVSEDEALLVDTPVNDAMTEQLLRWATDSLGVPIRRAILTHAHDDRMGGIEALKKAGVASYASVRTADQAERSGLPRPDSLLDDEQVVPVGKRQVLAYFPGAGHTADNIVVWLAPERILFGGCFLKSEETTGIGNIADADVAAWPASVRGTMARFPDATVIVPGHGPVGGRAAFARTLEILEENLPAPE